MQDAPSHPGIHKTTFEHPGAIKVGLFLLSAGPLAFEITLTRLFSVAQFYHFAFMIVSIALLGSGASGTALALFPNLGRKNPLKSVGNLALATSLSMLGAYLLTNAYPIDTFSIAWDHRQVAILALHYIALATPFFFSGMAVGLLLAVYPRSAGGIYAVNMLGSALGCAIALLAPSVLGGVGTVLFCSGLAALASLTCLGRRDPEVDRSTTFNAVPVIFAALLLVVSTLDLGLRLIGYSGLPGFDLHISPYKSISYILQQPGAEVIFRRWNSFSRVDVVQSASIHSIPGLSYRYLDPLPTTNGLLVDGDDMSPILSTNADTAFVEYLSSAIAYHLRPDASALVLEPRGGLDIHTALALGAARVTTVEANPLIVEAAGAVYHDPRVLVVIETDRSFLRRSSGQFDVIVLSLTASYHPVHSGAYSLGEDYRYTVESFQDALRHLTPGGLLVVTRWLQDPPSEDLRAFALAVTALEQNGADPGTQIVAFRSYNSLTILVRNGVFTTDELQAVRSFTAGRAFDMVYAPDIQADETNRYNILPESTYYQTYTDLLTASPRSDFYAEYPYDITPPTDDHPFFGHFFKWSQAEDILAELGRTWQPFGGAGYFIILALFFFALLLAGSLILLPLAFRRSTDAQRVDQPSNLLPLTYFILIGLAYLLVEIPLFQSFILYLGEPAYAMASVLFTLLLFSALGSAWSRRLSHPHVLGWLCLLLLGIPLFLPMLFERTLGLPFEFRLVLTGIALAPLGFMMGIPFPAGIRWMMEKRACPGIQLSIGKGAGAFRIPWIWAANGASSVVASILAALLALNFGFNWVFWIGALCYGGAWFAVIVPKWDRRPRSLHR
ncbi:MAG: hypothetical protein JW704_00925 [Anaerolineaceae bacterium]|nr:hypothetical protein [Anaerolineaceae bacterium]MBN2677341.1 hypothetical protein [Anaerolineaceae bacterium]